MARTDSRIYFVLTSISSVFMGMNCILFGFCVYVLWGQHRKLLLFPSIVQFILCIAQKTLFVMYIIDAFSTHPSRAENYFQHIIVYSLPCYIIYTINYAIEGFLLIWRIYVLYNHNIKFCIPSIILLLLQVSFCGVTAKGFATEAVISGRLHIFNLVTWALIAAVNISATVLICLRLWAARQKTHTMVSHSRHKSAIIIVVECGALVTVWTIAMVILYSIARPGGLAGLGIMTQVATMAPLLIIARYGILRRKDDHDSLAPRIPMRINVVRTEVTRVDTSMGPSVVQKKKHVYSDSVPDFRDGDHSKPFCDTEETGHREEDKDGFGSPPLFFR